MKKILSAVLGLSILVSSLVLTSCGAAGKGADSTKAENESIGQSSDGSAGDKGGASGEVLPLYELLKTGIVYSRDDVSDEYWNYGSVYTNEQETDFRFQHELNRPYTSDGKLQIAQTYNVYIDTTDKYCITINKDKLFYIKENAPLTDSTGIPLYFLSTAGFYSFIDLSLEKTEGSEDNHFEKKKAQYDREEVKYETKELNGWNIILREAEISLGLNQKSIPGYTFEFFYVLSNSLCIEADGGMACDKENAEIFMEKFVNNISFEKISEDRFLPYVSAENYDKIKLDDKITLKINSSIGFQAGRSELPGPQQPDNFYATEFFFKPEGLAFEGKEVERIWVMEISKDFKKYLNQDEDFEFVEYEYKGIKMNLVFKKTDEATELICIEFETDAYIYRIVVGVWDTYATKDQDYEAFVNLVIDNLLEIS